MWYHIRKLENIRGKTKKYKNWSIDSFENQLFEGKFVLIQEGKNWLSSKLFYLKKD